MLETIACNELIFGAVYFTIKFAAKHFHFRPTTSSSTAHAHRFPQLFWFDLLAWLAFTNIHHPQICEQSACVSDHHVYDVYAHVLENSNEKLRQLRAFVRPPIIQSSTPLLSPSLAVARRRHCRRAIVFVVLEHLTRRGFRQHLIYCHAFNVKHKQSTFDHHWFDAVLLCCCVFSIYLFFTFCIVQISAAKQFGYGELRTHSYGNCGERQGIN